jgi:tetratricopeptide (TPR) repeat protein
VGRKTGRLHFTRGDERRSVRFRRGHIVHAETNVEADHLGHVLVRLGKLAPEDLARADGRATAEKKRLGTALVELGILDRTALDDALALHVREILLRVFGWSDGRYAFDEEEEGPPDEESTLKLSTGEMILEAVRRVQDPDVVRYALGDIDRVLMLSTDPLLRFQKITLTPVDGYLLSRVDGTLSAREVIELAPVDTEEAQRSLFGLLCTGIAEYSPGPPKARPKRQRTLRFRFGGGSAPASAAAAAEPARARAAAPPASPPPPPAAPAQPPVEDEKAQKTRERRREVQETFEALQTKNHFEILGIPRASNEAQVKDAYFKLARRFHPDTHHDAALADLADQIEAVFIRLGEAYETLKNPRTRAAYEERLGPSRTAPPKAAPAPPAAVQPAPSPPAAQPQVPTPPAAPPPATEPPPETQTDPRLIEEALRAADKRYAEEKFWDVIQLLEPYAEQAKGRQLVRLHMLLGKAYLKNPKWVKRGEEELQKAVQLDPRNADAYFELALVYKAGGLKSRASSMLRKVVELRPDHEQAQSELAALVANEPPPPTDAPRGGLLKKLFGKS